MLDTINSVPPHPQVVPSWDARGDAGDVPGEVR
jgi:hypothetical protein